MSLKRTRKPATLHTIGHQTPAVQHAIATMGGTRGTGTTRRRKKRASGTSKSSGPRKRRAKTTGKLKKGSAAAKAWGAKMKRARKKKA